MIEESREFVPSGHFYSAIPNIDELRKDEHRIWREGKVPHGIDMNEEEMRELLLKLVEYPHPSWNDQKTEGLRYQYQNDAFSYGDSLFTSAMIHHLKPKNVIEIGSGWSSAAMLDTCEKMDKMPVFTFIEPFPARLKSLLTSDDQHKIHEMRLQDVDPELFKSLKKDDILFVDSTHVLKAGSDVEILLGEILPNLNSGVYIHFHDMFWPFEYPKVWVMENRHAWNEIYAIRSFLQYNNSFKIVFMNHFAFLKFGEKIKEKMPLVLNNYGGGLWIKKI